VQVWTSGVVGKLRVSVISLFGGGNGAPSLLYNSNEIDGALSAISVIFSTEKLSAILTSTGKILF